MWLRGKNENEKHKLPPIPEPEDREPLDILFPDSPDHSFDEFGADVRPSALGPDIELGDEGGLL